MTYLKRINHSDNLYKYTFQNETLLIPKKFVNDIEYLEAKITKLSSRLNLPEIYDNQHVKINLHLKIYQALIKK